MNVMQWYHKVIKVGRGRDEIIHRQTKQFA